MTSHSVAATAYQESSSESSSSGSAAMGWASTSIRILVVVTSSKVTSLGPRICPESPSTGYSASIATYSSASSSKYSSDHDSGGRTLPGSGSSFQNQTLAAETVTGSGQVYSAQWVSWTSPYVPHTSPWPSSSVVLPSFNAVALFQSGT